MNDDRCLRVEAEVAALARIANDDAARRELLWLRAMERDDEADARELELYDATLRDRMRGVLDELRAAGVTSTRDRQAWFARQWQARYDHHAGNVEVACACARCRICREA